MVECAEGWWNGRENLQCCEVFIRSDGSWGALVGAPGITEAQPLPLTAMWGLLLNVFFCCPLRPWRSEGNQTHLYWRVRDRVNGNPAEFGNGLVHPWGKSGPGSPMRWSWVTFLLSGQQSEIAKPCSNTNELLERCVTRRTITTCGKKKKEKKKQSIWGLFRVVFGMQPLGRVVCYQIHWKTGELCEREGCDCVLFYRI